MTSGGRRNRNGAIADPNSGRSDRRGLTLSALPATYAGPVPDYPLPDPSARELEVWAEAWTWPQANGWALPAEASRRRAVAMWVRTSVRCEDPEAGAALLAQLHRFADQAALTPAGMAEAGWAYAAADIAPVTQVDDGGAGVSARQSSRSRLKVVSGGA